MTYGDTLTALADPTRRGLFERLRRRPHTVGELARLARVSQPTVSQHLQVLRESGLAAVRRDGTRRLYSVDSLPLKEVDDWLDRFRGFWEPKLDALATEIARGKRKRRMKGKP